MSETFEADDGGAVPLGRMLGQGGEGAVHAVEGQPGVCAKVYNQKAKKDLLHGKLRIMVANPPNDPSLSKGHRSIAWPTRILYRGPADAAHFAGFIMPQISLQDFKTALNRYLPQDRRKEFGGGFTWRHCFNTAWNISSAVAAIHERGYCAGDINESNIMVSGTTLITIIDCDSFQVPDAAGGRIFRCPVGKPEYTAPELIGKSFDTVDRTPATDNFGLSVMLFHFLMEGFHPFQARGRLVENAETTNAKIKLGHFPYPHPGKPEGVDPPGHAPPFEMLHPEIQRLFIRAFVDGHKDPSTRPTSRDWYDGLRKVRKEIIACGANPNHAFFSHVGACPWCRMRDKEGDDPYPSAQQRGVNLPPANKASARLGPVLKVGTAAFSYRDIPSGAKKWARLRVENTGGGSLTGTLVSNRAWLTLPRGDLDGASRSQDIGFQIDTTDLARGFKDRAEIKVQTNGGDAAVAVELEISSGAAFAGVGGTSPGLRTSILSPAGPSLAPYIIGGVILLIPILGTVVWLNNSAPSRHKPMDAANLPAPEAPRPQKPAESGGEVFAPPAPPHPSPPQPPPERQSEFFPKSFLDGGIDSQKLFGHGRQLEREGRLAGAYAAFKAAEEMGDGQAAERKVKLSERLSEGQLIEAMREYGVIEARVQAATIRWVKIPAGKFRMGFENGDADEKPVHDVTLSAFQISKSEVTRGQWKACVDAGRCRPPNTDKGCDWSEGEPAQANHPVSCVNWHQAQQFCEWAGGTLPTEAQWEYAARGGRDWQYPWGNNPATCDKAVIDQGGEDQRGDGCGTRWTLPVCSKPEGKTRQGLCDVVGNVAEWVADDYGTYHDRPAVDPQSSLTHSQRVFRGGSFTRTAENLRVTFRNAMPPADSFPYLGFRCARDAGK